MKRLFIIFAFIALSLLLFYSIRSCQHYKELNTNNIVALSDSIHTYKDKLGSLVAYKTLLEGDLSDLKLVNKDLYDKIKAMKIPSSTEKVVYVESEVILPQHDTTWIASKDTAFKSFDFTDSYHSLAGNVSFNNDTLGLHVDKNEVYLDYTLAINDKNKVYISSSNPYIRYNEIQGLTIPKSKSKRFSFGPYVGYSYDITHNTFGPTIGIGVSYNLLK